MTPARRKVIQAAMVRFADGDRTAVETLLQELWPVLLAFARRSLQSEHDAEDVAQEVFVRLCAQTSAFDPSRDAVSWAFSIAAFEVMTQRRRIQRRRGLTDGDLYRRADTRDAQEDELIRQELLAALADALGELTDDDRATLGFGSEPHVQQVSLAALRKRRERALDRLRAVWRSLYGEP